MAYTNLTPRHTKGAQVQEISGAEAHYLLSLPAGKADGYRLAQLDDYAKTKRGNFPHRFPLRLSLSARTSGDSLPGTWGFGLWNHPFGLSLGFGGDPFHLPALPNAAWFFGASQENFLSFKDPGAERSEGQPGTGEARAVHEIRASSASGATYAPLSAQGEIAANGFLAQIFRSPAFDLRLIPAGLSFPFSRWKTRQYLGKVIEEAGVQLWSPAAHHRNQGQAPGRQSVDPTQWHSYRLDWREKRVLFEVDEIPILESPVSPHPPLGLVIWIDNQYAAFTPEGKIGSGVLENPEPAWLEVKDIVIA